MILSCRPLNVGFKIMALEKLGPYEFLGLLGRGGMGSVYRGRHQETGEIHAVKVLAQNVSHEDHFRGRFESEIQALIKLDHPNIVRILSYGQEDGNLFFAMELVEGKSLFQLQKKGHRFDWRDILSIAKETSKGLRHAHDRGIIHRDLKPGNLMMPIDKDGNQGQIKITDFGIAKRFGSSQNTGDNVLGTMDFMSPEQAKGQPVTIRSDLYSLGTVMFTLMSGKPPFSANSVEESLRNLTRVPAPHISNVVPDVPKEIDLLIQKLMAKRPDDRIQTAQALIHQIERTEDLLLECSQAQTVHADPDDQRDETFEVAQPGDVATRANTGTGKQKKITAPESAAEPTVEFTEVDSNKNISGSTAREIDYFNTVTDQIRKRDGIEKQDDSILHQRGFLPIVLSLVVVVALAGFGIYQTSRPPKAEDLYAEIEGAVNIPHIVLKEIDQFLEFYPNDERAGKVQELQQIGQAIQHYQRLSNKLSVRANMSGENRMTDMERQFMEIVDLTDEDRELASAKMAAFVTVHENDSELSPRDQDCLKAAKGYRIKIDNDTRAQVLWNLQKIRSAMKLAATVSDPAQAVPMYQSILELYGDIDWGLSSAGDEGRRLMQVAKEKLKNSTMPAPQIENSPQSTEKDD
jgi:serine/threonine protein kinase